MPTLDDLTPIDKAHWLLHINACMADTPSIKKDALVFLQGGELPSIAHPAYVHDWLEEPENRTRIEVLDG